MITLFSSESVTEGHPDKVADRISDSILDAVLAQDPLSRVACETAVTTNYVLVFGEITTKAEIDIDSIVRDTVRKIGYDRKELGFSADELKVEIKIHNQSEDIARGVDTEETGAGDQGLMFGYADAQTDVMMPLPIHLAHTLARRLAWARHSKTVPFLRPDGKTQVTVAYENGRPAYIHDVVMSAQHDPDVSHEDIEKALHEHVIDPVLSAYDTAKTRFHINPTGKFEIGGPSGDSGMTGRKIIVDTYGGYARHGGGAFSGKDATKVDRSAAYMARYLAKNIVAAGLAERIEIQIAYAIGIAEPVSFLIEDFNTARVPVHLIEETVKAHFDLRPKAIINRLGLRNPVFAATSAYGHFGRDDGNFAWERLESVEVFGKLLYNGK
jgi:S-adenosylmethionine synthetase